MSKTSYRIIKWGAGCGCLSVFFSIAVTLMILVIGIMTSTGGDGGSGVHDIIGGIDLTKTRLSDLTKSWADEILAEMNKQGVPEEYLPILLGILQNESGGGGVTDIFQASESRGWSMNDPRMTSELMSIEVGVEHFKNTLAKTEKYGKSILSVAAGYNFGHAFLDYLDRTNQDWTIEVAKEYSRTVVAPSLGNTVGLQAPYFNEVSKSYDIPYYYWNGGNFHYVPMLLWHLGFDLEQIREIALNGVSDSIPSGNSAADVTSDSFTYFGDSLVAGSASEFKNTFPNSNVFGTVSMMMIHPSRTDLDAMTAIASLSQQGQLNDNIVIQLGTNNGFSKSDVLNFVSKLEGKQLYFVTTASKKATANIDELARILHEVAREKTHVNVIDWLAHMKQNQDKYSEYYQSDEVHFTSTGSQAVVAFMKQSIGSSISNTKKGFRQLFGKFNSQSHSGSDLVEIAKSQIGLPYSWGGGGKDGPTTGIYDPSVQDATNIVGFDCSGFMQYIYYQAYGVDIGDWTVPQETSGDIIPSDQIEVGDLLFWGPKGATVHVAMYIGDNQLIESSIPGNPIDIHPMRSFDFAVRPDIEKLKQQQKVD